MKRFLLSALALCLFANGVFSQNYLIGSGPVADCKGAFFDAGGAAGNYANNQHLSTTICSNGASGSHVRLEFSGVDIAPGDALCFFDGNSAAAPLLACADDYMPGEPFAVQATAANPTGCLTVTFDSDATGMGAGWNAAMSCVASCQTVLAELTSTTPVADPVADGWIDICPGERVFFNGRGIYPQNGLVYAQSDLTTKFEWNFGDGAISYGPQASHRFDKPGGFFVQLILTDQQGCKSLNRISQRVRVAPKPIFGAGAAFDNTICPNDTVQLDALMNAQTGNANLLVAAGNQQFTLESVRSDSLALPDGTGAAYETSIYLTEFAPGQVVTGPDDFDKICVNMEHSWMRDLEIKVKCPSGKSAVLHNFGGRTGSEILVGLPNDDDSALNPIPGKGYEYCWTPTAANPTWLTYANNIFGANNGTLPPGDYQSFEPLAGLVGCPLNGEWRISVEDLWQSDNGFIFSWGLKFRDDLYPNVETFSPALTAWGWKNHPTMFSQTTTALAAAPENAGTANYVFAVTDDFGCQWDTALAVVVLPFTHPDCFKCATNFPPLPDTSVCAGQPVALNAASLGQNEQKIAFENYLDHPLGFANHPPASPFAAPITVSSLGFGTLTNALAQIDRVCLDIDTDWDSDLDIYLQAPNGKRLELCTGNGGSGDNFKNTCFSPAASASILGQFAPFTGTYRPEGSWGVLDGTPVNGDWNLVVSDRAGPTKMGRANWWNISFKSPYSVSYSWQNAGSLSCANCPNPTATPTVSTSYVVQMTDNFNCAHRDTAQVQIAAGLAAPGGLAMANMGGSSMTFAWQAVAGATGYQVNVNNTGWMAANGALAHTVSGLSSGNVVNIQVQAVGGGAGCQPQIAQAQRTFLPCNLTATLNSTQPAKCHGTATGSAFIFVSMAVSPVKYYPDGGPDVFNNGGITNYFTAGPHFVVVEDALMCRDTVFFTITEPPAIVVSSSVVDASCNGDNDGSATATVTSGGIAPFIFQWQKCTGGTVITGATANNLYAGCYIVTVTDGNSCKAFDTIAISEPPGFQFTSMQDSVNCFGGSDGSATIFATGGQNPYTYKWGNGATTQTATGLNANFHAVTVTDANGCQRTTIVQVLQPPRLVIDSVPVIAAKCFGSSDGSATCVAHGGTQPLKFVWETGANTPTATGLLGGDMVSVTVTDFHNCTDVFSTLIPEPAQVQVQTANISPETCAGACNGSTNILASGGNVGALNFAWSSPAIPTGTQNPTGLCPGTYTVTVSDPKGCTGTASATIAAATPIDIMVSSKTNPKCATTADGAVSISVSGGGASFSYQWSTGAVSQNLTGLSCGTFTVTVTDGQQCTKTLQVQLDCPAALQITNIIATPVRCFGESNGALQAVATGGTPSLSYLWNDPNSQISANASNLAAGTYTLTVTDANGCKSTSSKEVLQPSQLQATTTTTAVKCFGESTGTATAEPTGGTQPYSYNWSAGGQTTKQAVGLAAGAYSVTVSDAKGCTFGPVAVQVEQPSAVLQVAVVQTDTACFGKNEGIADAMASGGTAAGTGYVFDWSNGKSGQTQAALAPGIFTVTATDAAGCTSTASLSVEEYSLIQANIATASPTCFGSSDGQAAINNLSGGAGAGNPAAYHFQWSLANAPDQPTASGLMGGVIYSVTISDAKNCTVSKDFSIANPTEVVPVISTKSVSCNGMSDGEANVTEVFGDNPVASFSWSNGSTENQILAVPAGTYFVTVTDTKGCTGSLPVEIFEPDALDIAKFDVQPLHCAGDTLGAASATVLGGVAPYLFIWSNGEKTASISGLTAGVYALTVTDANGCVEVDSVALSQPTPAGLALDIEQIACFGEQNGRIRVSVSGGAAPYRYSLDGQNFIGSNAFFNLGAGDYTIYVKDNFGCVSTAMGSIAEPLALAVALPPDTTLIVGDSLLIAASVTNATGALDFAWRSSFVEKIACADTLDCATVQVKPLISSTYFVAVLDENGCEAEAEIHVKVEKPRGVFVPTGFTPNGDSENDRLMVFGKSRTVQQIVVFRVYDRWGALVYEDKAFTVNDLSRGWDGTFRGKDCLPGVYAWYAEAIYVDGYREIARGETTLMR